MLCPKQLGASMVGPWEPSSPVHTQLPLEILAKGLVNLCWLKSGRGQPQCVDSALPMDLSSSARCSVSCLPPGCLCAHSTSAWQGTVQQH